MKSANIKVSYWLAVQRDFRVRNSQLLLARSECHRFQRIDKDACCGAQRVLSTEKRRSLCQVANAAACTGAWARPGAPGCETLGASLYSLRALHFIYWVQHTDEFQGNFIDVNDLRKRVHAIFGTLLRMFVQSWSKCLQNWTTFLRRSAIFWCFVLVVCRNRRWRVRRNSVAIRHSPLKLPIKLASACSTATALLVRIRCLACKKLRP